MEVKENKNVCHSEQESLDAGMQTDTMSFKTTQNLFDKKKKKLKWATEINCTTKNESHSSLSGPQNDLTLGPDATKYVSSLVTKRWSINGPAQHKHRTTRGVKGRSV